MQVYPVDVVHGTQDTDAKYAARIPWEVKTMKTPSTCESCGTRLNRYNQGILCWPCKERVRVMAVAEGVSHVDVIRWVVGKDVVTRGWPNQSCQKNGKRLRAALRIALLIGP